MLRIKCIINQELGFKCKFGEEAECINNFLDRQLEYTVDRPGFDTITIEVSNATQLIAVDLYGLEHKITVEFIDDNGKGIATAKDAYRLVNEEFLRLYDIMEELELAEEENN